MKLKLVAVGDRMPAWIAAGFQDYAARMPRELKLELIEIPLAARGKNADIARARQAEGEKLIERARNARLVVLDERGARWSSTDLAENLKRWMQDGRDVALLVGGPDGHSPAVLDAAEDRWSLSRLTLPHALVRVLVAEQVYRAWSLLHNHPYHRG
ncbi:MAG: 23S rRNA (pseudouridine(1915)-N(3))-methyltransferase RlmH [Panacagrimonas sp.]